MYVNPVLHLGQQTKINTLLWALNNKCRNLSVCVGGSSSKKTSNCAVWIKYDLEQAASSVSTVFSWKHTMIRTVNLSVSEIVHLCFGSNHLKSHLLSCMTHKDKDDIFTIQIFCSYYSRSGGIVRCSKATDLKLWALRAFSKQTGWLELNRDFVIVIRTLLVNILHAPTWH